ncbi:MAG: cytochrome c oxidase subunit 3 [Chloroflexota bacterium]
MSRVMLVGGSAETAQRGVEQLRVEPALGPRKMGLLIFLTSESVLFGTFIAQYVAGQFQKISGPGPHQLLNVLVTLGFSVALWASSATVQMAPYAAKRGHYRAMRLWLLATFALGGAFLYGEVSEWLGLFHQQVTGSVDIWATTFFALTGLHGMHVILGLCLLLGQVLFSFVKPVSPGNDSGLEVISVYWHFVDAMWVLIFSTIYIWSAFLGS